MKLYSNIRHGIFVDRPNRFVAHCLIDGESCVCHVKNTGRCRELLVPGCRVFLEESHNPERKTKYDVVAVMSRGYIVNMDSQAPNHIFHEWVQSGSFAHGVTEIRPEVTYGDSRLDFFLRFGERQGFVEVKGVTLFDDENIGYFPDAPTERGVKHLRELTKISQAGMYAAVCFIVQRDNVVCVKPNIPQDPDFAAALKAAEDAGVKLISACCNVGEDFCTVKKEIPVVLE